MSTKKSIPINALASEIDVKRTADIGLASAIRLYVLAAIKAERDQKTLGVKPKLYRSCRYLQPKAVVSNSESDISRCSPWVRAREKLAIILLLRDKRAVASSVE